MGKLLTPILLLASSMTLAACMKQGRDFSPFPEFLDCTYGQVFAEPDIPKGFYVDFKNEDILTPRGIEPMSFKRHRGWDVDLRITDPIGGVAVFYVDPRGRQESWEPRPPSFVVTRNSSGGFSLQVGLPEEVDPEYALRPIPCSTNPEAE